MNGKVTAIVLGAGASSCYSGHPKGIPAQQNIAGRLFFKADTSSGEGFPGFGSTWGVEHSFPLARYLRSRFDIPEQQAATGAKLDFWLVLQSRGLTLETLYELIDEDPSAPDGVLADFEAILRTAVSIPTNDRSQKSVCKYHRLLCEALEPGDLIINFNWDSVMADALLHHSFFWFPATGFGGFPVSPLGSLGQKTHGARSLVDLVPIHGSVVLFGDERMTPGRLAYLGPATLNALGSWMAIAEDDAKEPADAKKEKREPSIDRSRRIQLGWLYASGTWLCPIFVPPCRAKPQYNSWYAKAMRSVIHSRLPQIQQIVVAGYSFPDSDRDHLSRIFVRDVIDPGTTLTVVDPQNHDTAFRERVESVFGNERATNYESTDFREFCDKLAPSTGAV